MLRFIRALLCAVAFWTPAGRLSGNESAVHHRRHLFDAHLTPASEINAVMARVTSCGIEIPASELRAFQDSEPPVADKHGPLTRDEKRGLLERLLDEHFLLAAAYRDRADESPDVIQRLRSTRNMLLQEMLRAEEVDAKVRAPGDYARLDQEFRARIFDQARVVVSSEAYDELKSTAKKIDLSTAQKPAAFAPVVAAPNPGKPLATCKIGVVTIGDVLEVYAQLPPDRRPDLAVQSELIEVLRRIMTDALIVEEARSRGLEETDSFQQKLQINRNVLTRFAALDRLTDKAVARLKAPGQESRVRRWYEAHLQDRYTVKDADGRERVVPFEEERESIENDYFDTLLEETRREELQMLRRGQKIEIDEARLDRLVLTWSGSSSAREEDPPQPAARVSP